MTTDRPVAILDLPIGHLAKVEKLVGARMTEWPAGVDSVAQLYATILAAGLAVERGLEPDEIEKIYASDTSRRTMAQLVDLVELAQEGEPAEQVDPT